MPKDAYLESRVLTADPVELIHILYEHVRMQVTIARSALAAGDIAGRSKAISKALAGLGELEGSLNFKDGGAIARNFRRLYQYMRQRLVDANLKQEDAPLAEVESLIGKLDDGWVAMQRAISAPAVLPYAQASADMAANSWSA